MSRDVVFVENSFPMNSMESETLLREISDFGGDMELEDFVAVNPVLEQRSSEIVETSEEIDDTHSAENDTEPEAHVENDVDVVVIENEEEEQEELGVGKRKKTMPVKLNDYVLNTISTSGEMTFAFEDSGSVHPISKYVDCENFSPQHRAFLAAIGAKIEPTTFSEAIAIKEWCDAMSTEVGALEKNRTWDITTLPPGKKAIGCKWIYKLKFRADGTLERYKARLVVLGNNQKAGIDFTDTFAPVVKMSTVRTFLEVAAARNWELHQMDVHNAFVHGDLEEEVYMKLPPGFRTGNSDSVCRLRKSLYGLKQAPRCWFAKLKSALTKYGFKESYADYSMFFLQKGGSEIYILVYVDDLVIGGNDSEEIAKFKKYLGECFHMKDLGPLQYFLGIEVARNKNGIFLCQRKYALDIITEAGLLGCKPAATPLEQQHKLDLADGPVMDEPAQYRRLVGRLLYLLATRPDLTYAVHVLSQFMQNPRVVHWESALRVVRYLKGTPGQGILLRADSDLKMRGWSDSDWGSCRLSRKSVSGWYITLGQSPISWKSKKQKVVSRSSAEAEYRCMALTVCELEWLRALLADFGVGHDGPMDLFCDNQAALYIAANPVFHERTKHVEIDCHCVRNAIQDGQYERGRYIRQNNWPTCSLRHLVGMIFNQLWPSWAFATRMLQLEGGC